MFQDFTLEHVDVGDAELRVRWGGSGPPVLLLHGHPRTHTTWHRVAPLLASDFTVVCPDLRGYGQSSKPATTVDHAPYSKRAMAGDCADLMRALGHDEFAVAGHDRGSYVAFRLALDHPELVHALAALDCVPIGEALAHCDARFAHAWYHWFFFAQPEHPERLINADPDRWYATSSKNTPERLGPENFADFHRAVHDPATVSAMLEDYRAGLGIDRVHDDADKATGRRLHCRVLAMWSLQDDLGDLYDDIGAIWRGWADDVRTATIDSGHHMAEEAPQTLAAELRTFFRD
jgi:haloacetate dehalogenase